VIVHCASAFQLLTALSCSPDLNVAELGKVSKGKFWGNPAMMGNGNPGNVVVFKTSDSVAQEMQYFS